MRLFRPPVKRFSMIVEKSYPFRIHVLLELLLKEHACVSTWPLLDPELDAKSGIIVLGLSGVLRERSLT